MKPLLHPEMLLVSATKGIENDSLLRMSRSSPTCSPMAKAAFSLACAPSADPPLHARWPRAIPPRMSVASADPALSAQVQETFSDANFRLYRNDDVIGVELGGSVKNVIAIAAGVVDGIGYGHNTVAGLITRGLAEMTRLAVACGGRAETMAGLAGLGDLVLTCTGGLSRNRSVGVELGRGRKLDEIIASMHGMVAEGVLTTSAAVGLAHSMKWRCRSPSKCTRCSSTAKIPARPSAT